MGTPRVASVLDTVRYWLGVSQMMAVGGCAAARARTGGGAESLAEADFALHEARQALAGSHQGGVAVAEPRQALARVAAGGPVIDVQRG
jgi:hypothetical protein